MHRLRGADVAQACPSCTRSWDDRATFCGACGAHLAGPRPAATRPAEQPDAPRRWRWAVLAVVVAVGTGIAVPAVTIDRTPPPVDGEVGVPEPDVLQPAGGQDAPGESADGREGREDGSRGIPPPQVSCWRDGTVVEVPCVLWVRRVLDPERHTGRQLAMANASTLVTAEAGRLRGFDVATGRPQWEQSLARPVDTGTLGAEVGVLHYGGRVHAFATDDGRQLWTAEAFHPAYGRTVVEGQVLTADRDADGPRLVVRDAVDGTVRWEARTDGATVFSIAAAWPDAALVATHDDQLLFLDRASGEPAWEVEEGMRVLDLRDELLLVAGPPGGGGDAHEPGPTIRAIDLPDGTVRWERTLSAPDGPLDAQRDLVVASTPDELTAMDVATGQLRWTVAPTELEHVATRTTNGSPSPRPAPDGAVLTIGSESGILRARDPDTGAVRWEHTSADPMRGAFLEDDGLLLVPTEGGITALDAGTGRELLRVRADGPLHPVGAGPALLVDHRSGYAVGFDFPDRQTLREAP